MIKLQQFIKKCRSLKCPLTKEEKKLLYGLSNEYEVTDEVCDYYRKNVKNNTNDNYIIIKNKLIRNIILGKLICAYDGDNQPNEVFESMGYRYGNLQIHYNTKTKMIFSVINNVGDCWRIDVDMNKKKWLDKKLGLK